MSIVLQGATSGSITLQEPAIAGSTTLNLPASSGTVVVGSSAVSAAGQIPFSTDGSTYTPTAKIVSGTAVASTSGTSIDFTSIPSWVKRITVMFSGVSTNGTADVLVQIGAGSVTSSGYVSGSARVAAGNSTGRTTSTTGYNISTNSATSTFQGSLIIQNISSNSWVSNHTVNNDGGAVSIFGGGTVSLSGTLDRVRITTSNGTDTFDAGTINILYE